MPTTPRRAASAKPRIAALAAPLLAGLLVAGAAPAPASAPARAPTSTSASTPVPAPAIAPAAPPDPLATEAAIVAHPETSLIEAVFAAGPRLVAVGRDGLIALSDDQGLSWRQVRPPVQATLTALHFTDDQNGWAVGHYGVVLRTTDAGESWSLVFDGARAAQLTLDAALGANQPETERRRQVDAARQLLTTDPARPFQLIQTDGPDTVRLIGAGGLAIASDDGGKHWRPWSNAIDNPQDRTLLGLTARDGVVVACGEKGLLLAGRPEDGLSRIASPTDGALFGALNAGPAGIVLYGQQGHVYAGNLAQQASATKADAWRRVDVPTQNGFTAGLLRRDGSVLLADNSGATWALAGKPDNPRLEAATAKAPFAILSMAEASDDSLILAGSGGLLRIAPPPPPVSPPTPPKPPAPATTPQTSQTANKPTTPPAASPPTPPASPATPQ